MLLSFASLSKEITPELELKVSGNVIDIMIVDNFLYAGTDSGTLEVYDINSSKFVDRITLPKIHDFMGDLMPPKVYCVDVIGSKKLLLSEGEGGFRELYISENNIVTKVITSGEKLTMNKAKFIDQNRLFLALLSNEIVLYDLDKKKQLYKKQLSQSKFSDLALNENKTKAAIACESGINYLVDVSSGDVIKELKGGNKDNVFKVSFKAKRVLAGGQDRVCSLYDVRSGSLQKSFNAPFLVYAVALNKDATLGAFSYGQDNEIAIFDLKTGSKRYTLKGQKSTLNSIVFYNQEIIFSGSDDKYIMKWKLK
jgi:WD40 repeat protein